MDISAKPAVLGGAVQFATPPGWTTTIGRVAKIALHVKIRSNFTIFDIFIVYYLYR